MERVKIRNTATFMVRQEVAMLPVWCYHTSTRQRHCVSIIFSAQEKPLSAQKGLFFAFAARAVPRGGWAAGVGGTVRAGEGEGLQTPPQGLLTVTGGSGSERGPGWGSLVPAAGLE